jgi:uncharacterized membrane protein YoaK (UPF0700 family)
VTGNFVTLSASLAEGSSDTTAKILALPLFCAVVFGTRILRFPLERSGLPILGIWLTLEFLLLTFAAILAVHYGPFPDVNAFPAVSIGLMLVVAMALQNAFHRIHLSSFPPSTVMTGTTTQAMLDLADLFHGVSDEAKPKVKARVTTLLDSIVAFAVGCAIAALIYAHLKEWVFVGAPILGALTIGLHIREKMRTESA